MNFILLSIIGSILILDKYAFGEFGISQPIISGTIIGALFGDIQAGLYVGAMLQLLFLGGLPIGRDIPPDGQVAGIIGSGTYLLLKMSNPSGHSLLLAMILAISGAIIGGAMAIYTRRFNEKLFRMFTKKEKHLPMYHFFGLITAFLRGLCIFTPIFLASSIIIVPASFPQTNFEMMMILSIGVGFANALYLFLKKSTLPYLILGALCGLVLLVL